MLGKTLLTPMDDIVGYAKEKPNCTISYLKDKLNVPSDVLERWLVILDENEVVTMHYRGLKGFVSLTEKQKGMDNKESDIEKIEQVFIEKCRKKNLSFDKMQELWPKFLEEYIDEIKKEFFEKAKKKGFNEKKTEKAWERFKESLKLL